MSSKTHQIPCQCGRVLQVSLSCNESSHELQQTRIEGSQDEEANRKPICHVEFIDKNSFAASVRFDTEDIVVNQFLKLRFEGYDPESQKWTFNLSDFNKFVTLLYELRDNIVITGLPPQKVLSLLCFKPKPVDLDHCLEFIQPDLVDTLLPFQREGVVYGIAHEGSFMLADGKGLGKTRQALAVADYFKNDWPLLIVTLKSEQNNWLDQVVQLLPNVNINKISIADNSNQPDKDARVVISYYGALQTLETDRFGIIIYDQCELLRHNASNRSIYSTELAQTATRLILITSLPAIKNSIEMYPQLSLIKHLFMPKVDYTHRYTKGYSNIYGYKAKGTSKPKEFAAVLSTRFMIRRERKDILAELCAKDRNVIDLTNFTTIDKEKEMKDFKEKYNASRSGPQQKELLIKWSEETARLKSESVCDYIENFTKSFTGKFVVFAHHDFVMDALADRLKSTNVRFVRIDERQTLNQKFANIDSFQIDTSLRCAIVSIRDHSKHIKLTAADTAIFAEIDWNHANVIQAESRLYRGDHPIKYSYITAPDTADEVLWDSFTETLDKIRDLGLAGDDDYSKDYSSSGEDFPGNSSARIAKDVDSVSSEDLSSDDEVPRKSSPQVVNDVESIPFDDQSEDISENSFIIEDDESAPTSSYKSSDTALSSSQSSSSSSSEDNSDDNDETSEKRRFKRIMTPVPEDDDESDDENIFLRNKRKCRPLIFSQ